MNFADTPAKAAFRAEARAWTQAHARTHLHGQLWPAGTAQR